MPTILSETGTASGHHLNVLLLLGPLFVKFGVNRAGEVGLNVREEDLIEACRVADVMDAKVPIIPTGTPLEEVIRIVSGTEAFYVPVVDSDHEEVLAGVLDRPAVRRTLSAEVLSRRRKADSIHGAPCD